MLPAGKAIKIVGDGGSENGTVIGWNGHGTGPGLRLRGPSRATVREMWFSFVNSGADAIAVDNADQPGGRIYCDQVVSAGNDPSKRCDVAVLVDGVENSDVTFLNGGWGDFTRGGVVVRGGPVLASGGTTRAKFDDRWERWGTTSSSWWTCRRAARSWPAGIATRRPSPAR